MAQYPLNIPVGANLSAAITTNTTTAIQTGKSAVMVGYVATNAGSAWTIEFYNGDPAGSGVSLGPAVTVAAGFVPLLNLRAPNGLYVVTAGTTAGSLKVAYF